MFHHEMANPQIVDEGDTLKIHRVAANIVYTKWWTIDKE
jgi:hypothetical protein